MFILIIMAHGGANDVIQGSDGKTLSTTFIINDLLSPAKFPKMSGKPKVVIIVACRGGKRI